MYSGKTSTGAFCNWRPPRTTRPAASPTTRVRKDRLHPMIELIPDRLSDVAPHGRRDIGQTCALCGPAASPVVGRRPCSPPQSTIGCLSGLTNPTRPTVPAPIYTRIRGRLVPIFRLGVGLVRGGAADDQAGSFRAAETRPLDRHSATPAEREASRKGGCRPSVGRWSRHVLPGSHHRWIWGCWPGVAWAGGLRGPPYVPR